MEIAVAPVVDMMTIPHPEDINHDPVEAAAKAVTALDHRQAVRAAPMTTSRPQKRRKSERKWDTSNSLPPV